MKLRQKDILKRRDYNIKKIIVTSIALAALMVIATLASMPSGATSPDTAVSVVPDSTTVEPGDSFSLEIMINPGEPIAGAQVDVLFDPAYVTVNSVSDGGMFNMWYSAQLDIDNAAGEIRNIIAFETSGSVSTEGVFATLSFTATALPGESSVALANVVVGNPGGEAVTVTLVPGAVTVNGTIPTWDEYFTSIDLIPIDRDIDGLDDAVEVKMNVDTSASIDVDVTVQGTLHDPDGFLDDDATKTWPVSGTTVDYESLYLYADGPEGYYTVTLDLFDDLFTPEDDFTDSIYLYPPREGDTTLSLSPSSQTVSAGDTFTVNLILYPNVVVEGAQADLSYNPTLLTVTDVDGGDLFDEWLTTALKIDNINGSITNMIAFDPENVSTAGVFASITFQAQTYNGLSPLTLKNVIVSDPSASPVPLALYDGMVTITGGNERDETFSTVDVLPFDSDSDGLNDAVSIAMDVDTTVGYVDVVASGGLYDPNGFLDDNASVSWQIFGDDEQYKTMNLYGDGPEGLYDVALDVYDDQGLLEDSRVFDVYLYPPLPIVTYVNVTPSLQTVFDEDVFSVCITVESGEPLLGVEASLVFDPALLMALEVTEGDLFDGLPHVFNDLYTIDNINGTITGVAGALTESGDSLTSPGILACVEFQALGQAGISLVNLTDVIICRLDGQPYPALLGNGMVNVSLLDVSPPVIQDVIYTPMCTHRDGVINISVGVTDTVAVDEVYLSVEYPDYTMESVSITGNKTGGIYYCTRAYHQPGRYNFSVWANDTSGNQVVSSGYTFCIANLLPVADFIYSPQHPCLDTPVIFDGSTSYDPDGDISEYYWGYNVRDLLGHLYAGGTNPGVVYQYRGDADWDIISPVLGYSVLSIVFYDGYLYAGIADTVLGNGSVYRYDGVEWLCVGENMDARVSSLVVYEDVLYAGTGGSLGARLYQYNAPSNWSLVVEESGWTGIRSAYAWKDYLYLGDASMDLIGRFDGYTFEQLVNFEGSCIYDFEEYDCDLYASAWHGRMHRSNCGDYCGDTWDTLFGFEESNNYRWALEEYKGWLYSGFDSGDGDEAYLKRYNGMSPEEDIMWSIPVNNPREGIISLASMDEYLYLGLGGEAFTLNTSAVTTGEVYRFNGLTFESVSGPLGTGVQVLYYPPLTYMGDQETITYSWDTYGIYNVTLRVRDENCGIDTMSQTVTLELSTTQVNVSPVTQIVPGGNIFTVDITVDPGDAYCVEIAGAQFNLSFDPLLVTALGIEEGTLFAGTDSYFCNGDPNTSWCIIDNLHGIVTGVAGVINTTGGGFVSSPGIFATITFQADTQNIGTSPLILSNVIVGDPQGQPLPIELHHGNVTILDSLPPEIKNVTADPWYQLSSISEMCGGHVNLSACIGDNVGVEEVFVTIIYPDGTGKTVNLSGTQIGGCPCQATIGSIFDTYYYNASYAQPGEYQFFFSAADSQGNGNTSPIYTFCIYMPVSVSISPESQFVCANDTFTVDVYVDPGDQSCVEIAGVQFDLTFDPSLIMVIDIAEGDLFHGYNSFFACGNPGLWCTLNNSTGLISGVAGVINTTGGGYVSSPGIFATITFQAKSTPGTSPLKLADPCVGCVIVGDPRGEPLPITLRDGEVKVGVATTKTLVGPQYNEHVTSSTVFSFTSDSCQGSIDAIYYRIWHNGIWTNCTEYTTDFTLSGECKHYIEYYAVDTMGNTEIINNQTHYVDNSAPISWETIGQPQHTPNETINCCTWVTTQTPITLSAQDRGKCPVGPWRVWYRIWNNGHWSSWSSGAWSQNVTFYFTEECKHYLEWYAEDALGNMEPVHNQTHYVDDTPPESWKTIGQPKYGDFVTTHTMFTLGAEDEGLCPVESWRIIYRIWNGAWSNWTIGNWNTNVNFKFTEECMHYLEWYAEDALTNKEPVQNQTHYVDDTPPMTNKDVGNPKWSAIPLSSGTSITIYEYTTCLYVHTFLVSEILYTGVSFDTAADEHYVLTGVGDHLLIECTRPVRNDIGNNIVAVRLNGVPEYPDGIWATVIIDYTLGSDGLADSCIHALGENMSSFTCLGNTYSSITLGFCSSITSHTPITLIPQDPGTCAVGIKQTYYRVWYGSSWTPWLTYSGPFTMESVGKEGDCIHEIEWYSIDYLNNEEEHHSQVHYVDDTPPVTTKETGDPQCILPFSHGSTVTVYEWSNYWVNSPVPTHQVWTYREWTFNVDQVINTGVTFITPDGETYTLTSDGTTLRIDCSRASASDVGHNIACVRLDDVNGYPTGVWVKNVETYSLGSEGIETTLYNAVGNTFSTYTELGDGFSSISLSFGTWITSDTPIMLDAYDVPGVCSVGLDNIYYRIGYNGGWTSWHIYTGPFTMNSVGMAGDCEHTLEYYSADYLGNREIANTLMPKHYTYYVDDSSPVTIKTVGLPQYGDHVTTKTPITLTCMDTGSCNTGHYKIYYTINGVLYEGSWDQPVTIYFAEECTHTLAYWAIDCLNNTEEFHTQTYYVDDTPPVSWETINGFFYSTPCCTYLTLDNTVTLSAIDLGVCPVGHWRIHWNLSYNGAIIGSGIGDWDTDVTISFNEECQHCLTWWAEDSLNNAEQQPNMIIYHVDSTPPILNLTYPSHGYYDPDADLYIHPLQHLDPRDEILEPTNTYWHELAPHYSNEYSLVSWDDVDINEKLTLQDSIKLENSDTGEMIWYTVDSITLTLYLDDVATTENKYIEFTGIEDIQSILDNPLDSQWIEIYPLFGDNPSVLTFWEDDGDTPDGYLSCCDIIQLTNTLTDTVTTYSIIEATTDLVLTEIPYLKKGAKIDLDAVDENTCAAGVKHIYWRYETEDLQYPLAPGPGVVNLSSIYPGENCITDYLWYVYDDATDIHFEEICYHRLVYFVADNLHNHGALYTEKYHVEDHPPMVFLDHVADEYEAINDTAGYVKCDSDITIMATEPGSQEMDRCADAGVEAVFWRYEYDGVSHPLENESGAMNGTELAALYDYTDPALLDYWWYYTDIQSSVMIEFVEECRHDLYYWAKDHISNYHPVMHHIYHVDCTAPNATDRLVIGDPSYDTDGDWFNETVTTQTNITILCEDTGGCAVGIQRMWYRIWWNGSWSSWQSGDWGNDTIIRFDEMCIHYLEWYAEDKVGNNESMPNWTHVNNETFYVDETAPETILEVGHPQYGEYITTHTPIWLNTTDPGTCAVGCEYVHWEVWWWNPLKEDWEWKKGCCESDNQAVIYIDEECKHKVIYYAVDYFNHTESVHSQIFMVDDTPPTIIVDVGIPHYTDALPADEYFVSQCTPVWVNVTDDGSESCIVGSVDLSICVTYVTGGYAPVCDYSYIDEGTLQIGPLHFTDGEGIYYLNVTAVDDLGNRAYYTGTFYVDNLPPEPHKQVGTPHYSGGLPPGDYYVNSSTPIWLNATDYSGVSAVYYYFVFNGTQYPQNDTDAYCSNANITYLAGTYWYVYLNDTVSFGPLMFPEDGVHYLSVRYVDNLGQYILDEEAFIVDNAPPVTIKTIGDPSHDTDADNISEYVTTQTPLWLTATDISDIQGTYYRVWCTDAWHPQDMTDTYGDNANITLLDGTYWYVYSNDTVSFTPFIFQEECTHYLEFFSIDNLGQKEDITQQIHYVDDTPPISFKHVGQPQYESECCGNWVTTSTPITLSATDIGDCTVGDWTIYYQIYVEGVLATSGSSDLNTHITVTFSEEGNHTIEWWAVDALGNIEDVHVQHHLVDDTPPVITKTVGEPSYQSGYWVTTNTSFQLDAQDKGITLVGVYSLHYEIWFDSDNDSAITTNDTQKANVTIYDGDPDDLNPQSGEISVEFNLDQEGLYELWYYSTDLLFNMEMEHRQEHYVDNTPPLINVDIGTPRYPDTGTSPGQTWDYHVTGETPIWINQSEALTNCVLYYSILYNGSWHNDSSALSTVTFSLDDYLWSDECIHRLHVWAEDALGNTYHHADIILRRDGTPPSSVHFFCCDAYYYENSTGEEYISSHTYNILEAEDTGPCISGVKEIWYNIYIWNEDQETWEPIRNDTEYCSYCGPFQIFEECTHKITWWSYDNLNNQETPQTKIFHVDNSPPESQMHFNGPYYTPDGGITEYITVNDTHITITAIDQPAAPCASGVKEIYYRINAGDWQLYTEPFVITEECEHILEWYSIDQLGHTEDYHTRIVYVDDTPPQSHVAVNDPSYGTWDYYVTTDTPIWINITDPGDCAAGVKDTYIEIWYDSTGNFNGMEILLEQAQIMDGVLYSSDYLIGDLDGALNGQISLWINFTEECHHMIQWYSVDYVGNNETPQETLFHVDDTSPVTLHETGVPLYTNGGNTYVTTHTPLWLNTSDPGECAVGCNYLEWEIHIWDEVTDMYVITQSGVEYDNQVLLTFTEECRHKLVWWSQDHLGHTESVHEAIYLVDDTPPVTTKTVMGPVYAVGTPIVLNATDGGCQNGSGVAYLHYEIWYDSNNDSTITANDTQKATVTIYDQDAVHILDLDPDTGEIIVSFTFDQPGYHEIWWYSIDHLGNQEILHKQGHHVGDSPFLTHKEVGTPKYGFNDVYVTTDTSLWLNATNSEYTNDVGVNHTCIWIWWDSDKDGSAETLLEHVCIHDGSWYNSSHVTGDLDTLVDGNISIHVQFQEECYHEIWWYSVDYLGNNETILNNDSCFTQPHYVDDTPPVTTKEIGSPHWDNGSYITSATPIYLNTTDMGYHAVGCDYLHWEIWWWNETINGTDKWMLIDSCAVEYDNQAVLYLEKSGMNKLVYWSADKLGNMEKKQTQIHYVDNTAPIIHKIVGDPHYNQSLPPGDYYVTNATSLTITATDTDGISAVGSVTLTVTVTYLNDTTTYSNYTSQGTTTLVIYLEGDCIHSVTITAQDNLGNMVQDTEIFYVDNTPPVTTIDMGLPHYHYHNETWLTTSTPLWLNTSDPGECAVGCNYLLWEIYIWDEVTDMYVITKSGMEYDNQVLLTFEEECRHKLVWWSQDHLGNTESVQEAYYLVDDSPPVTTKTISGPQYAGTFVDIGTHVFLNATDEGCQGGIGAQYLHYEIWWDSDNDTNNSIDTLLQNITIYDNTPQDLNPLFGEITAMYTFAEECYHEIHWYSCDYIANTEPLHVQSHHVDDTPPQSYKKVCTSGINCGGFYIDENDTTWITNGTYIFLDAEDPGACASGVKEIWYNISIWNATQETWVIVQNTTLYTGPFNILEECHHRLTWWAIDNIGNQEMPQTSEFYIDNTGPSITLKVGQPQCSDGLPPGEYYITNETPLWFTAIDTDGDCIVGSVNLTVTIDYLGTTTRYYDEVVTGEASIGPLYLEGDCIHYINVTARDDVGNTISRYTRYHMDLTPPLTTKTVGEPNWNISHVTTQTPIWLNATDPGNCTIGVCHTYVEIWYDSNSNGTVDTLLDSVTLCDGVCGNSTHIYGDFDGVQNGIISLKIQFQEQCHHVLKWYSVDCMGNTEDMHEQHHYVDDTPPAIDLDLGPPYTGAKPEGSGATITPDEIVAVLPPGGSLEETKIVTTEAVPIGKLDVFFIFDATGSQIDTIATAKASAIDIMTNISGNIPDVTFGVASLRDYPGVYTSCGYSEQYGLEGDYPWILHQDLTPDQGAIVTAINEINAAAGQDFPEAYNRGLYESQFLAWREGSRRLVFLFEDDVPHECDFSLYGCNGAPTTGVDPGRDQTVGTADDLVLLDIVAGLKSKGISVIFMDSNFTASPNYVAKQCIWTYVAEETNGLFFELTDASELPSIIVDLVENATSIINNLTLRPQLGYDNWVEWTPLSYENVMGGETISFDVTITVPEGTAPGLYYFYILVIGDGSILAVEDVWITVSTDPGDDPHKGPIQHYYVTSNTPIWVNATDQDGICAVGSVNLTVVHEHMGVSMTNYTEVMSGVASIGPLYMEGEGIHYLNITARDNLGNMVQDSVTFCTDDTPPVTEKFVNCTLCNQSYYLWNTSMIWLNATDNATTASCFAGVKYLHYEIWWDSDSDSNITGNDTLVYTDDSSIPSVHFTLADYGIHLGVVELRYYATDMLDNQETEHSQVHDVVLTPP